MSAVLKFNIVNCGNKNCEDGYYRCGRCTTETRRQIWLSMTEKQKAYDRHVDPTGAFTSGYSAGRPTSCTCHINPPCSHCADKVTTE